jgi:toxin secretion/phage lysis holin
MEEMQELVSKFHFTNEMWVIMIPIILMGIDIITGLLNAWLKGEVKSSILRKGLAKKIGEICVILIGELFVTGLSLPAAVSSGISLYLIIMELISICENLEKLGVPIPNFIKKALATESKEINKESDDKEEK